MTARQLKYGYFALAALNTLASNFFFNYLFFFLRDRYGFGNRQNLWTSALYGFVYIFSAWQCGKFAQRRGFVLSLKIGFLGLAIFMAAGGLIEPWYGILAILVGYSVMLLFTWPALEALVSQNESRSGVQHMVGIYNCTWSAAAALSYFVGGSLYDWLGRGAVFWLPAGIFFGQYLLLLWLSGKRIEPAPPASLESFPKSPEPAAFDQGIRPEGFLKMAWWANPFAYVAMNTLLAVMPGIAERLALSPSRVGLFCSIWFFARLVAFAILWRWSGWHYHFRWLLTAYVTLMLSFMLLLLAHDLWVFTAAQALFGLAAGLIYYSSLYYSMDVGEASAEHGGLHEAAIGVGVCAGPAVGAAALQFLPAHSNTGVFAVTSLLCVGLIGLLLLRRTQCVT